MVKMLKENCLIDNIPHIKIYDKCVLCDKQWCSPNNEHGLAKYEVISDNGSTRDFICDIELDRYTKRGWKINAEL